MTTQVNKDLFDALVGIDGEISLLLDVSLPVDLDADIKVSDDRQTWVMGDLSFEIGALDVAVMPEKVSVIVVEKGKPVNGNMVTIK